MGKFRKILAGILMIGCLFASTQFLCVAQGAGVDQSFDGYTSDAQPSISGWTMYPTDYITVVETPSVTDKSLKMNKVDGGGNPSISMSFDALTGTVVMHTKLFVSSTAEKEKAFYLKGLTGDSLDPIGSIPFLFIQSGKASLFNGNGWMDVPNSSYTYGTWLNLTVTIDTVAKQFSFAYNGNNKGTFALKQVTGWDGGGKAILWDSGIVGLGFDTGDTAASYCLLNDFKIKAISDFSAPSVNSIKPADGATNVSVNSRIDIGFNNDLNMDTFGSIALSITKNGLPVSENDYIITVGDEFGRFNKCNVAFKSAMVANAAYAVTVKQETKDVYGNTLASDYTATFTTQSDPNAIPGVMQTFDQYNTGELPTISGWELYPNDGISVVEKPSVVDKSLKLNKAVNGGNPVVKVTFEPLKGTVVFQTKLFISETANREKAFYLKGVTGDSTEPIRQIPFLFIEKAQTSIFNGNNWANVPGTALTFGKWLQITISIDTVGKTFTIYYDGISKGTYALKQVDGWDGGGKSIDWASGIVGITMDAGDTQASYCMINDFKIREMNNIPIMQVASTSPANNTANVPLNSNIEINFSNEFNMNQFTATSISVSKNGTVVPTSEYTLKVGSGSGDIHKCFITFNNLLESDVAYTVTVNAGIKDIFNQSLFENNIFTFNTADSYFGLNGPLQMIVLDSQGQSANALSANGSVSVTASLKNTTEGSKDAILIICIYDEEGVLVGLDKDSKSVADTQTLQTNITLSSEVNSNYTMSVFLWNDFNTMVPLMAKKQYPAK